MKKVLPLLLLILLTSLNSIYAEDEYSELYLLTVSEDIKTSDFHELTAWCGRLSLSTEGSADEMRQRLYDYYEVDPSSVSKDSGDKGGNLITIESADNLDYFTIEQVDENYVEIIGKVILTLIDNQSGETHKIKADKIIFNFKEDYLTASGNIEYILEGESKTENFKGDKITFNVETWEGLFNKGVSQEDQVIDSENINFYFKGDLINKTEENYVLLEKGEITSCDLDDPHYKLKAEKLWMLSGDEWAMLSGVLYIGRVPVLYIPAYLNAGDEIFFNPVLGHMSDFGYFLQTTTYLIGRKEQEDSTFSFLQSDDSSKYNRIDGIYLTADDNPDAAAKDFVDSFAADDYLKIILDFYSNVGIYGAVNGDIGKLGIFDDFEVHASLGYTRKIESTSSGYTYLFDDGTGVYSSIWLSSYFYNIKLPFRYDLDIDLGADFDWFDINLIIESYSDSYYTSYFSDRSETLDLLGMLNESSSTTTDTAITSADWQLEMSLTPEIDFLKPWVSNFSVSSLQTSIDWSGKDIDTSDLADTSVYDDTVSYFFYPQNWVLPSVSASISGTILPLPTSSKEEDKDEDDDLTVELRPPWEDAESGGSDGSGLSEEYMLPDFREDREIDLETVWGADKAFSNKLTYSISSDYSNKTQLQTSDWATPEDIDLSDIEYSVQSAGLDASLSYSADIFGNFIDITDTVKFSGQWDTHYNMDNLTADDQTQFLLEDNQATEMTVKNNLKIKLMPLIWFEPLSKASLTYQFNNEIYSWDYSTDDSSFVQRFMQFESEDVSDHGLDLSFPMTTGDYKQTITVTSTLPPLDLAVDGSLVIEAGISDTEINTALSESDGVITWDPLTFNERLSFRDNTYIDSSISYDYSDLNFEKTSNTGKLSLLDGEFTLISDFIYDFTTDSISELSADLTFYDFYLKLNAYETEDYSFNSDSGWVSAGTTSFQAKDFSAGINIDSDEFVLWKNRLSFDFAVDSSVKFDLVQFTDSDMSFSLEFNFELFEFMTLTFKSVSTNTAIYKYFPAYTDVVGVSTLNVFEDLLKSFNFFDSNDRYESNFNLSTISLGLTHDLHDWELTIAYSGKPYVDETVEVPQYEWENELSIYLNWKAVKDIKTEIEIDNGVISF